MSRSDRPGPGAGRRARARALAQKLGIPYMEALRRLARASSERGDDAPVFAGRPLRRRRLVSAVEEACHELAGKTAGVDDGSGSLSAGPDFSEVFAGVEGGVWLASVYPDMASLEVMTDQDDSTLLTVTVMAEVDHEEEVFVFDYLARADADPTRVDFDEHYVTDSDSTLVRLSFSVELSQDEADVVSVELDRAERQS